MESFWSVKFQRQEITDLEICILNLACFLYDYIWSVVYSFLQIVCEIFVDVHRAEIGINLWLAYKYANLDCRHNTFLPVHFCLKMLQSNPCPNTPSCALKSHVPKSILSGQQSGFTINPWDTWICLHGFQCILLKSRWPFKVPNQF